MTTTKNKYSVSKATKKLNNGKIHVIYLSSRDEEQGKDISLDMNGWTVEAL